ncbi:hypothetical protein KAR91_86670, partial [Candidatus Pacearchaeota archaeon]|nr:hypothetical protein [Candidatus Pacearchaeota archaeon]
ILFFAKHAFSLHNGTSPHRVKLIKGRGLHFWATKKGISPHAVALSIKRKGTKANAFLDRAVMRSERTINKIFSNALKAIARAIKKINI